MLPAPFFYANCSRPCFHLQPTSIRDRDTEPWQGPVLRMPIGGCPFHLPKRALTTSLTRREYLSRIQNDAFTRDAIDLVVEIASQQLAAIALCRTREDRRLSPIATTPPYGNGIFLKISSKCARARTRCVALRCVALLVDKKSGKKGRVLTF